MFYIQYNEGGFITATVTSENPIQCPRQLVLDEPIDVTGLMVIDGELTPQAPEDNG